MTNGVMNGVMNRRLLFVVGPIYAVVYYTVFRALIHLMDLKTPGREPESLDQEVGEGDLAEAEPGVSAPAQA